MPRSRKSAAPPSQTELLDITAKLRTGPCVPALREAVKAWKAGGYKGITDTTRILLNYWFETDHRTRAGAPFKYHGSQCEAVETLIFVWEFEKIRTRKALLERYVNAKDFRDLRLPPYDDFARYCIKMATGSGKTKVMALAIAWQFFNAMREPEDIASQYAKTFLVLAPNVIVLERLKTDFSGGQIFIADPVIPKELEIFWDFDCVMRGDAEKAHAEGTLFLTNIHQFYERPDRSGENEPAAITDVLGPKPPAKKLELKDFGDRIALRAGNLLVVNDEAHHTHDEDNEWNSVIRSLHAKTPLTAQLDFSATPRFQKGAIFPWTISDFPLKQAILENIVKRPVKGIAKINEARSDIASVRYAGHLVAGVQRWREYRDQLKPLKKKPVLFIMMNSTDDADDVAAWLKDKYPGDFGAERTQVIHTKSNGEITETDLDKARAAVRNVDQADSPIHAIVSVLMLREGWDVQNVTVVVGLRPYSAKAKILPEQAIGRGLRLMFRDLPNDYTERVDIIGNNAFLEFVDDLERLEEMKLDTFELGKDKLEIITILPLQDRKELDIGLPMLTPSLIRKKSLADEIAALDVMSFKSIALPKSEDDPRTKTFTYEGYDIITLKKEFEREYTIPEPQTAQEVIGYYARRIAEQLKLPAQFAALAPKVREFFEQKAFGHPVDLEDPSIVKAMSTPVAHYVCVDVFKRALQGLTIDEQEPTLLEPERMLSTCQPFPWSRPYLEARSCVFNLVPCDNEFEKAFAKFLDGASDVKAFSKLPRAFGFTIEYTDVAMNLRNYEPDFVATDKSGTRWILETKGQEDIDVARKDVAAIRWCENATKLTGTQWKYVKVPQKEFQALQPRRLADLAALSATLFDEVDK
ncbi:MAG TPA: DEAD/DEAH box helicase family protein [Candidatus Acidoferrales bacterium]|nr:DEAD/DEAH box helicase family protein [Candidatus Acidoferrales bacterium]